MGDMTYAYQLGGSLPPDAPTYILRQADRDLLEALLTGTYCYVLNARQMGKSSLRVHTVERLFEAGVLCVEVELLGIGSQHMTASQWYGGIIQVLISSLGLRINRRTWLHDHEDLSPVQRLGTFIEQVVLPQTEQPLVIFFDEIDSVLGFSFPTDEFFGLVRHWYEKRATDPAYQRLTVVMLGVTTPSDLIEDQHSTPFNIGQAIELQGFSVEEARPLAQGLASITAEPGAMLSEILRWTGGQPFLTQKLCWLVSREWGDWHQARVNRSSESGEAQETFRFRMLEFRHNRQTSDPPTRSETGEGKTIRDFIQTYVIAYWETQDEPEHLRTIRDRLLQNARHPERLLRLYQTILKRGAVPVDHSREQVELRLTGLVTRRHGQVQAFNRIYRTIFDQTWVATQLNRLSGQTHRPVPLWQIGLAGLGATALVVLVRSLGILQPLELYAFDHLMRSRPLEPADDRFLIITVSEADMQYQDRLGMNRRGSLADEALLRIWQKLIPHEPRVVGLDLYHDFPFSPALADQLTQDDRFIAVCEIAQTVDTDAFVSIPAPPDLPIDQVGFTDFASDPDYRVRRQILGMDSSESCSTDKSFNLKIALRYLAPENGTLELLSSDLARLDDVTLPKIPPTVGGYQLHPAEQNGFQILVNYRGNSPRHISLREVLEGNLDTNLEAWVRDRIVLIGIADPKDSHFIPMQSDRMLGITVHAHMASQLISAVLDDRPLLWWLPDWGEGIWILGWAILGSGFVVGGQRLYQVNKGTKRVFGMVGLGGIVIAMVGSCYVMLLVGGWLPLVAPLLALAIAAGSSVIICQMR